jgi:HEAT repeat protein
VVFAQSAPAPDAAVDAAFAALKTLELGQTLDTFQPIEQAVARAHADEKARADLEARLAATLGGEATDLARDYACRQLALVGSDASVPALAALVPKPRSSYMARYALEGIGSPAAAKALRDAIGATTGPARVGVVISLGRLADAEASGPIAALLGEEDPALREAAVVALGRIGTAEAAAALATFAPKAPEALRHTVVAAELQAAERLCRQGSPDAAIKLYESLQSAESERVRAAAYRGLISAKPSESAAMILAGLAAAENWKRAVAADCLAGLATPDAIATVAAGVPKLPPEGKFAAFDCLKSRSHAAIRAAALAALEDADAKVREAAVEALVNSGAAEDVPLLARLAATGDEGLKNAACDALQLMTAEGTNQAMLALMSDAQSLTPVLVRCALERRRPEFVPGFLHAAESADAAIRLDAFKALEIMATEKDAEPLARLLCKTPPGDEREAAGRAVWMSCQKIADPAARVAPLLAVLATADAAGQCAVLPSLARLGGEKALAAVRAAMTSPDQVVRDAGHRALANWPDASVADALLEVVKTSDVESYRVWSLRAYARVVSLPSERPPQQTFEMLRGAMALAGRAEDKQLIVERLGSVAAPEALSLLLTYLDDPALRDAAVPAVFASAKGLSQSHPAEAKAALEKIQTMTKDEALLQQIPKVLRDIEARAAGK